jgi:hypothetical protein
MKPSSIFAALLLAAISAFAEDPASFEVGAFTFNRPADWQWVPVSSPMRKAQLKAPSDDPAKSAEITFFHFGPSGGDVQSNAERWLHQFEGKPEAQKIDTQEVGKTKVTFVTAEGTYHSGMPGGPTTPLENYALLGAILENPEGSVFAKMTGPVEVVKAKRQKFIDFINDAAKNLK